MKTIHDLPTFDKPREKLVAKGAAALRDEELMAVMLGSGIKGKDVRRLASEIVTLLRRETIDALCVDTLRRIDGMGTAKAAQVVAAMELGRRFCGEEDEAVRIACAADAYALLKPYGEKKQEHFVVLTLDGASRLITQRTVFIGTLTHSVVHPREVFADALTDRAAGIIVAHNHPSQTLDASDADRRITRRLQEAGRLLGIELLDHLIVTKRGYVSFEEEGWL